MANTILRNKEVDKTWAAVEVLLKVDGSKTVVIPHKDNYNVTATGFALSMILQPGTSFSLSKKTTGGYTLTYASGNLTWTVYNASTSISVSAAISTSLKSHVLPYVTTAGNIGIYINGESVVVSGSTITGDFSNSSEMVISGTCLIGFLSAINKVPSYLEIRPIVNPCFGNVSIIPITLHPYIQGYWPCQEKYGDKLYDCVDQFDYAKGTPLTANHATLAGYSDTELGTTDKTTQTYRVDFYDKTTTNFWDGSGNELKTGLPELKNGVLSKAGTVHYAGKFSISAGTPLANTFQGAYTIRVGVFIPNTMVAGYRMMLRFAGSQDFLIGIDNGIISLRYGLSSSFVMSNSISITSPGFYFITVTRNPSRTLAEFFVNHQKATSTDSNILGQPVPTVITMANQGTLVSDMYHFHTSIDNRPTTFLDHLNWMNNTTGSQGRKGNILHLNWNGIFDITGTKYIEDKSVNNTPLQLFNYTADQLNPAHADYVVKSINSLR